MNKLFKITDHKYLQLTIQESPFFELGIKQIFANNETDFLTGVYNVDNPALSMGLTFPEFSALSEFMFEWIREMALNTEVMNQLIESKKEE